MQNQNTCKVHIVFGRDTLKPDKVIFESPLLLTLNFITWNFETETDRERERENLRPCIVVTSYAIIFLSSIDLKTIRIVSTLGFEIKIFCKH